MNGHLYVDEHNRVVEYDEAGVRRGTFGGSGAGALSASEGVAVNGAMGQVYASDAGGEHRVEAFGPAVILPDLSTGEASNIQPTSATLNGTVKPDGVQVSDCHFDYGTTIAYGQSAPCVETVGSGTGQVSVHADVTSLVVGTTYHFRLRASNANGPNLGQDATFSTPPPPAIGATTVTALTISSADLNARINPGGIQLIACRFDYGTDTSYGYSAPCAPSADKIPADSGEHAVSAAIASLRADTTYHWRVIATNAAGTTTGADHTFIYPTTGNGALPDSRAYEMVTPPHKNGALLGAVFLGLSPDIAEDGSRVVLSTLQCFKETSCPASRGTVGTPYAFTRTPAGWLSSSLAPSASEYSINSVWTVNANDGTGLFSMPTSPAGEDDFYARRADGSLTHIGPVTSPAFGAKGSVGDGSFVQRATGDYSRFAYEELSSVWPFDESAGVTAYGYSGSNAQPTLIGVSGGYGSVDLISSCATTLGGAHPTAADESLSTDGRLVYFTAAKCASGMGTNAGVEVPADALYARVDESEAVEISARSPGDCHSGACATSTPGNASFEGASADGTKAFFSDPQQLTDTASEGSEASAGCSEMLSGSGCNLYEYDFAAAAGHRLVTVSARDTSGGGPRVQGVVAISQSGARVYFVARGVLSATGNTFGEVARDGAANLYVFERDLAHPAGRVSFVTVLSDAHYGEVGSDSGEWRSGALQANTTPDGRFLLFASQRGVTPEDSRGDGGPAQVFRYDAQTGALVRVSIGDHGFNDNGNAGIGNASIVRAIAFQRFAGGGTRNPSMSNDGSYVFFMSPIGLTPQALNDVPIGKSQGGLTEFAQNVYEYHDGRVFLISDGRDTAVEPTPAVECDSSISAVCLVGMSGSGRDVFFTSSDPLAPQDTDTQLDYYDARVCTPADPCISAGASPSSPCDGEACHGIPSQTPGALSGGSAGFRGAGNAVRLLSAPRPSSKRCKRGFARKRSRCTKVKQGRGKRARRSKPGGHHAKRGKR